jgi:hypothetical protein
MKRREWEKQLAELADRYGFEMKLGRGGHYKLTRPGCRTVIAASSASDWRAIKNTEAYLRQSLRGERDAS